MTVFQVKAIKPQKMKLKQVQRELEKELIRQGDITERLYKKTVQTWKSKPKFESIIDITGQDASVLTGPTGSKRVVQKFVWVDEGTRPHIIKARRRTLKFRSGKSKAKTKPGVIGSGRGRPASGPYRYPRSVRHPGTKARKFTETIQKRRRKPFTNAMIKAKNRGLKNLYG